MMESVVLPALYSLQFFMFHPKRQIWCRFPGWNLQGFSTSDRQWCGCCVCTADCNLSFSMWSFWNATYHTCMNYLNTNVFYYSNIREGIHYLVRRGRGGMRILLSPWNHSTLLQWRWQTLFYAEGHEVTIMWCTTNFHNFFQHILI